MFPAELERALPDANNFERRVCLQKLVYKSGRGRVLLDVVEEHKPLWRSQRLDEIGAYCRQTPCGREVDRAYAVFEEVGYRGNQSGSQTRLTDAGRTGQCEKFDLRLEQRGTRAQHIPLAAEQRDCQT
jgi:hypothetical protein